MEITIYQIIPELDKEHVKFRELAYLQSLECSTPNAQIYEAIYHGKVDASSLEDIYRIFNRVTESDALFLDNIGFTGHSLSVSDIVEIIDSPDKSRFYFCCSIGFQQVTFEKNLAMGKVLNHDYTDPVSFTRQGSFYLCFMDEFDITTMLCSGFSLERCKYSQSQLGYRLCLQRGDNPSYIREFLTRPSLLLFASDFGKPPEELFYQISDSGLKVSLYPAHSPEKIKAVEAWCQKQGIFYEYI